VGGEKCPIQRRTDTDGFVFTPPPAASAMSTAADQSVAEGSTTFPLKLPLDILVGPNSQTILGHIIKTVFGLATIL